MPHSLWNTMNKNNHNFNRYIKIINYYQQNNNISYDNTEIHHIIPRSLGGSNIKGNRIKLPVRAHFIAHMLLWKSFPGCIKMAFAVHQMSSRMNGIKSSRIYEMLKKDHSIACAIRNTGRVLTPEWRDAIRDGHKNYNHAHLKTDEAKERARVKANTVLNTEDVIRRRQETMRKNGYDNHPNKREEFRRKLGKINQFARINAISPEGELFEDIWLYEFIGVYKISKFMIKKYLDKGVIPPPSTQFLARWNKLKNKCDERRILATGWAFKSVHLCELAHL